MTADRLARVAIRGYLALFFAYLFLPLGVLVGAAFNASRYPTLVPWEGLTGQWFADLLADRLMGEAAWNSLVVGLGVVAVSVPVGTAGALVLSSLHARARTLLYGFLVSPILTPGVIIGIATLIFWNRAFGVPGGLMLTVVAQSSFIAAYCMLLVLARLERFDRAQEEAALSLGASRLQVFRRITLPFLAPALYAGAFIAFLQSFENFNTTLFVVGTDTTLPIRLASMVRQTMSPSVNALAVIMIATTVAAAAAYEVLRRRGR